jgi:hypothetical protein
LSENQEISNGQPLKSFQLTTDIKSKSDYEFGKKVAANIYGTIYGNQSYFWLRNNRFRKNRQIANGKMDMSVFLDRLEMNAKSNYVNINWKSIIIGNTIVSRIVGAWMSRREKIVVTAVDPVSIGKKNDAAAVADYVLQNKGALAELQQESGVQTIPQDQFVAEDKDDLDAWRVEFNNLPEEILFSLQTNDIMAANGWDGVLKEKALHDSAEVGLVATYTWMDDEGEIHIDWIRPENVIYSYSDYPDFRDTAYRGHISSMKISEIRARYGKGGTGRYTEEEIFRISMFSKEYQLTDKIKWMQDWNVAYLRPYDEWNIDVVNFEIKTLDQDNYTVTKTKKNGSTIIKKGVSEKLDENQQILQEKKWNIYKGVYCPVTKDMFEWGLKKNMIRPQDPKEMGDAEFSYSFFMYQQYDMRNVAVPEKIEEPIEQMILARLKIQQLVAKMVPSGAAIDVDAMQELFLGLGDGAASTPLDIEKIWMQTGKLYYRGRDAEGNPIPVPIRELSNTGFAPQMEALMKLYQFHYQVLKDELGEDPNLMSQAAQPRVTSSNIQASQQLANNATDYMYDAFLYVMEETGKKVACLLNASVRYGAKTYRKLLKEEDVSGRNYIAKVNMLPTDDEVNKLEAMLNNAIASNPELIVYIDPFKIMRMAKEEIKLAELYFRQAQKRYLKTKQQEAQQNSQMNAQSQQQSIEAKGQQDAQLLQAKTQQEAALQQAKTQSTQREIIMQGLFDLAKVNLPVPPMLQQLIGELIQNVEVPIQVQNQQMQQGLQQQAMQQQQEAQAQQQEQQQQQMGGPDEGQEPQQQEQGEQPSQEEMEAQAQQQQMQQEQMQPA